MREDELQALFLQEDSYCAHINPKTGLTLKVKCTLRKWNPSPTNARIR